MSTYSEDYCYSHDIDYFFVAPYQGQKRMIHCASNGSLIPSWIDQENNILIQKEVYKAISLSETENPKIKNQNKLISAIRIHSKRIQELLEKDGYKKDEISNTELSNYQSSFCQMATLGFYSFDINGTTPYLIANSIEDHFQFRPFENYLSFIYNIQQLLPEITPDQARLFFNDDEPLYPSFDDDVEVG